MTGLRPDEISGRLIPPSESKKVEDSYLIGEYNYDAEEEPEESDEFRRLYPKYWHTSYGQFKKEDKYLELCNRLERLLTFTGNPDPDKVDDLLDEIGIDEFYRRDKAFINHMREAYCVPNKPVPDEESRKAARLWIKYLLERGPKKD